MSETIKFLNLAGLSQYNGKIQEWVLSKIAENNNDKSGDIAKGVSAYNAWVKFLEGSDGTTLNLAAITTKLSDITGDIANLENAKADKDTTLEGYGITDAYTKTETDAEIAKVKTTVTKDGTLVSLTTDGTGANMTISVDETALNTALDGKANKATTLEGYGITDAYTKTEVDTIKTTIDAYTVNGKAINTNPVLYAGDIAMSNTDATTVKAEIEALKGSVSGGTFFRGVFDSKADVTDPKNGDVIAVDNKEYIYYAESTADDKWIELGDTTVEGQRIADLEGKMITAEADIDALEAAIANMDTEKSADATATATDLVTDEIAVVTGVNLTQVDGVITALTVDSAKAATTKYVDDKVSGIATSYVKSFGGKTGEITLSVDGNVTLEMVDNALKASIATITADDIDALFV